MFRPHWWDIPDWYRREPDQVGTGHNHGRWDALPSDWQIWHGPYPAPAITELEGSPAQWARGTLYSEYLDGKYGRERNCLTLPRSEYTPLVASEATWVADTNTFVLVSNATVAADVRMTWFDVPVYLSAADWRFSSSGYFTYSYLSGAGYFTADNGYVSHYLPTLTTAATWDSLTDVEHLVVTSAGQWASSLLFTTFTQASASMWDSGLNHYPLYLPSYHTRTDWPDPPPIEAIADSRGSWSAVHGFPP